jgi:hypothetical protein
VRPDPVPGGAGPGGGHPSRRQDGGRCDSSMERVKALAAGSSVCALRGELLRSGLTSAGLNGSLRPLG